MYRHSFCYLLDVYISPPPPRHVTESTFCILLPEAAENGKSHVMFLAFELPFNFISFQTMLWHSDSLRSHRTLSVLSITATMHAFERDHRKIIIFLQLQSKRLTLIYLSKNFLSTLPWMFIRSPLCPANQQSRISDLQICRMNLTSTETKYGI
jgi:hypothetical protein